MTPVYVSLVSPCNSGAVSVRRPSVRQFAAADAAAAVGADQLLAQRETKNSKPLPPVRPTSCYRRGIEAVSRPVRGCVEDTEVVLQLISRSSSSTHQLISLPRCFRHTRTRNAVVRGWCSLDTLHSTVGRRGGRGEGDGGGSVAGGRGRRRRRGMQSCRGNDERGGTIHDRACGVSE